MHYEFRFGGTGGQGMMLLGDVMAWAFGCLDGREVLLTKSYGPESRGGACRSELIVDDGEIGYPVVAAPDFLLAMSQQACDRYAREVKCGGILLVDGELVDRVPEHGERVYRIPLTAIARETTGKAITANVAALGAVSVLAPPARPESVREAVMRRFPGRLKDINLAAFRAGVEAAEKCRKEEGR